jgi:penicillin-binding protein 1A
MEKRRNNNQRGNVPKKGGSFKKTMLCIAIIFAVMITGIGCGFLTASINTKPNLADDIRPPASSQIYDINGNLIANVHASENRVLVKINKIPQNLQNAFVAVEDARFYDHYGVDPRGILRAVWANMTDGAVSEGGSTITQQLAKNAYLTQDRTIKRKIQEMFLALQLERQYTKQEILEMYLNQIYFGQGAYGVQAAAQTYFGKNVEDLNLSECAMLAGIPKSPNYYSPLNNLAAANERKETVLDQMEKYGYINSSTANQTKKEALKLAKKAHQGDTTPAAYFVDYVTQKLIDKYGADAVYKDGLKIYTTLDMDMQHAAEAAMQQLPTYHTDSNGLQQPQGALVAIEPQTGYIKAMVGGRGNDQFNRATMAERQPGSAFKPFVFISALENKMTPSTIIDDSPITIGDWSPQNYERTFSGKVTLRTVAEESMNVPTVKIAQKVGIDRAIYYAQEMGISTLVLDGPQNDKNLATALGGLTKGVTPLELASAYGTFANRGIHTEPVSIIKILDRNGKVIEQSDKKERSVVSEKSAYLLTDMLKGVITHGTGGRANIGRPAAGKTGTTSDYKDAWFVGYTPDLVAAVWIGNDDNTVMNGMTGGREPASVWKAFMQKALAGVKAKDFVRPNNVGVEDAVTELDSGEKAKDKEKNDKDSKLTDKEKAANKAKLDAAKQGKSPAAGTDPAKEGTNQPAAPAPTAPDIGATAGKGKN